MLSGMVGEQLAGRPGGSVSLAVGMSYVFYKIPGLTKLMAYWYHFCIMFEALFILTTIDAGTRIGRYLLQDLAASVYKPFAKKNSWGNIILFSALMSFSWGYLLYTGNVSTIWPLFGVANQTLAAIAFAIGTTFLIKNGKQKYMLITVLPLIFISVTTFTAAIENIFNNYIPQNKIVLAVMSTILVIMLAIILFESVKVWIVELKKNRDVMNKKEITE